jgi:hypothetical protein
MQYTRIAERWMWPVLDVVLYGEFADVRIQEFHGSM